jgi:hypothetical protein
LFASVSAEGMDTSELLLRAASDLVMADGLFAVSDGEIDFFGVELHAANRSETKTTAIVFIKYLLCG